MNWILDSYSSVYQTAMMQPQALAPTFAPAKEPVRKGKRAPLFAFLRRR